MKNYSQVIIWLYNNSSKNVLETSKEVGAPLPLSAQLMEIMQAIKLGGCGVEDHSSIVKYYEKIGNTKITRN